MNAAIVLPAIAPALLCGLLLPSTPASACSCVPQSIAQAKQEAAAIFEGRVTAIVAAPANGPYALAENDVTLTWVRGWRGVASSQTVTVRTADSSATCGYNFALGESYLVYAGGTSDELLVNNCGRTRLVREAREDLEALGAATTPGESNAKQSAPVAKTRASSCAGSVAHASNTALLPLGFALGLLFRRAGRKQVR